MKLVLKYCTIRNWRMDDKDALAARANSPEVARCLRDMFPHPYTIRDAEAFLKNAIAERPVARFCIEVNGAAAGGIGIHPGRDVHKYTASLGYWLAEEFWGRGIMTEAVSAFTDFCFRNFPLHRIFAEVFSSNPASARVLEKAGFTLEGQLRNNVVKGGQHLDSLLYARIEQNFLLPEIPPGADEIVDLPANPENVVFVAGSGRSGTTWVAEIINHDNRRRFMFEPFEPHQVPRISHFNRNQYLRPENSDPHYLEPVRQILSGWIRNEWIDQHNRCRVADGRLIKDVRSLLFLKWLATHFPKIPVVYVLRHPLAVVHSRMQLGWHAPLPDFLEQRDLMVDHLNPFVSKIENIAALPPTAFEPHFYSWCLENYVPLQQFHSGEMHIVFYERLCVEPEKEIRRLFTFLNKAYDVTALQQFRNPSARVRRNSPVVSGGDLLGEWQKSLTASQIDFALRMLQLFKLDRLYGRDVMPLQNI